MKSVLNKVVITEKVFDYDKHFILVREMEFTGPPWRPRRDFWAIKRYWESIYKSGHSYAIKTFIKEHYKQFELS